VRVFYTASSHHSVYLLKNSKQDASLLRNHVMYLSLKGDAKPLKGKAYFYDDDHDVPPSMRSTRTRPTRSAACPAPRPRRWVGGHSQRWSPERVGSIARYFGGQIGDLVTLDPEDAAPAASTQASKPEGTDDGEERQRRTDGRQAPLRDAIARANGNPSKPAPPG
jgi:hypothetical protein